jgi:hypothetical protein
MRFQRNQPPTEQKIAMPFIRVLECVSRNLLGTVSHVHERGMGWRGYALHLCTDQDNGRRVRQSTQGVQRIIFSEQCLPVET